MASKIRRLGIAATLAAVILFAPGCALLAGGATGAGVGAIAGSTTDSKSSAATVGGLGGAAGGALMGAAVGDPLVGAVAGGLGGAATGYEVKKHSSSGD